MCGAIETQAAGKANSFCSNFALENVSVIFPKEAEQQQQPN